MRTKTEESLSVKAEPFTVELPSAFRIEPNHVVALPAGCSALVYAAKTVKETGVTDTGIRKYETVDGWRVVTVTKSGGAPRKLTYDRYTDATYSNPLDVKMHIERVARLLSKTTTKNVRQVVEDAEEE